MDMTIKFWMTADRVRLASVAAVLALVLPTACGDGAPAAPSPAPTEQTLTLDQLVAAVAERLVPGDFVEPLDESLVLDVRGDLLFVKGVVNSRSHRDGRTLLDGAPGVRTAVLTMVLGSVDDEANFALGRLFRNAGVTTYLPAQGLVASGGTDLFLAGERRIVERGARVGVHSWVDGDGVSGDAIPRDDSRHRIYLDYYRDIGIAEDFYWFTLGAAPAQGMHWMSEAEMARYAVYTVLR